MIDIEYLSRKYFVKNKPVIYKLKCGIFIEIYPVLVKDWDIFEDNYDILTYEKNQISSPEIIQMSYLQFIIEILFYLDEKNKYKLVNILEICLKENDIRVGYEKNKPVLVICQDSRIKYKIYQKDFDEIKKIILYQNIIGYDDSFVSKDIKNVIDEYWKAKNGDLKPLTLEDKMIFLGNEMGKINEEMLNWTYREFIQRFNMSVERMDYQINKTAEMSGNVKFDKPIEHIIYRKKRNKYEQYFSDKDSFVDKINNA